MSQNQLVGTGLIVSLVLATVAYVFEAEYLSLADAIYTFAGFGFYIFGIWGAVLLFKK